MCIVIAQNTPAVWFMQCQRISYAVWNLLTDINPPCLQLYPIAAPLIENGSVKLEQSIYCRVPVHAQSYHQLITYANPATKWTAAFKTTKRLLIW